MKQCSRCRKVEIQPDKEMCHDCFLDSKNLRMIEPNEIVFDVDNRMVGLEAINQIAINLLNESYNFEIYFAEGQKSPHLHIKNILHLDLTGQQLKKYKELFIKKHTPKEFLQFTDLSICSKHAIAEELKTHFKYGTTKKLLSSFNEQNLNFVDDTLYRKAKETIMDYKSVPKGSGITAKIIKKISIIDVAEQFGISVEHYKALCPFHADCKTPSLVFYESEGRCHCFGCQFDGNLIYFYAKLKLLNPNFRYKKNG